MKCLLFEVMLAAPADNCRQLLVIPIRGTVGAKICFTDGVEQLLFYPTMCKVLYTHIVYLKFTANRRIKKCKF